MNPCISTFTLTQLTPLLKTEAAIKLHACAYDVDEKIFSKSAMEEYLKNQRYGGKASDTSKPKSTIDIEEAKLKKARTKALKPSDSTDSKT